MNERCFFEIGKYKPLQLDGFSQNCISYDADFFVEKLITFDNDFYEENVAGELKGLCAIYRFNISKNQ